MARLLVDAEFYVYRYAAAYQEDYEWSAGIWSTFVRVNDAANAIKLELNRLREEVKRATGEGELRPIVLCTGDPRRSFRHSIYPQYKANRKARKPVGYAELLRLCLDLGRGQVLNGFHSPEPLDLLEGDDMLGVYSRPGDILVGVDKDFCTLPLPRIRWEPWHAGWWARGLVIHDDPAVEADRWVFRQALAGDAADGYPGCPGVGKVRAESLLRDAVDQTQMWQVTRAAFERQGLSAAEALRMVQCARLLRPGEYNHERRMPIIWSPPLG